MEVQIKTAVKAGNSSAVVLPRAWLNKEIRVELVKKTSEMMLFDTFKILKKYMPIESIVGIYLVGSYARGEEDIDSDIDILIITDNIDKEMINEGLYNILVVSYQLFHQKLKNNLFPIGQMIKEAKPLLNADYINDLNIEVTRKNVKYYLDTSDEKINIIEEVLCKSKKEGKKDIGIKVGYTLILRIRTLEIIKKLIQKKNYSKKDFIKIIKRVSKGINAYDSYLSVKDDMKEKKIKIKEAELLLEYLKKDLIAIKSMIKK